MAGTLAEDKVCHTSPIRLHPSLIRRSITQSQSLFLSFLLPHPAPKKHLKIAKPAPKVSPPPPPPQALAIPELGVPVLQLREQVAPCPKGPLTQPLPRAQLLIHQLCLPCHCPSRGMPPPHSPLSSLPWRVAACTPGTTITTNQHTCLLCNCDHTGSAGSPTLSYRGSSTTLGNRCLVIPIVEMRTLRLREVRNLLLT